MKAAVLRQQGEPMRIEDIRIDDPKEQELAIRVVASGVCHSDYSVTQGVLRSPLPVVLGHEAGGIVDQVGPGVEGIQPGDKVIAALTPSCGTCPMCKEGKPFLCFQTVATMGHSTMVDGSTRLHAGEETVYQLCGIASFAERAVIPSGAAIKIPDDVPLETACLVGCGVTTGVGAVLNTAQVEPETSVAVLGCGGVGLSIVQGARIAGAGTIIAIDLVGEKRELALELGATHVVDASTEDVAKAVRGITRMGAHYAFEAIGKTETIELMWSLLRPTGKGVVVGMPSLRDEVKLRVQGFFAQRQITGSVYGSAVPHRDIPKFLELYRKGKLDLDRMITRFIRLEEVNDAFQAMGRGEGARSVIVL
jgi:S-(hydroxymethyl)glutathione dehydrogenase/alcohol dehydrogenase